MIPSNITSDEWSSAFSQILNRTKHNISKVNAKFGPQCSDDSVFKIPSQASQILSKSKVSKLGTNNVASSRFYGAAQNEQSIREITDAITEKNGSMNRRFENMSKSLALYTSNDYSDNATKYAINNDDINEEKLLQRIQYLEQLKNKENKKNVDVDDFSEMKSTSQNDNRRYRTGEDFTYDDLNRKDTLETNWGGHTIPSLNNVKKNEVNQHFAGRETTTL